LVRRGSHPRLSVILVVEGSPSYAMRALESIRQSGRVVGIISHVSELQSRIPTMIRIWKTASGSAAAKVIAED
jgi:DNA repair exonuclease SbcCD ATPase subunit